MAEETVYCLCRQPYDETRFMIQCDVCKDWFHGSCVHIHEHQASDIEIYHCPNCRIRHGPLVVKQRRNWHRHDYSEPPDLRQPVQTGTVVFIKELKKREFPTGDDLPIKRLHGSQLTQEYFDEHGFNVPILVERKDGLGMIVPPTSFTVRDVENCVGSLREVDVIDVGKQEDYKMVMKDWTDYYYSPNRSKIFNIISLEFSQTKLTELVEPPLIVRQLSWVHNHWPEHMPEDSVHTKPEVQKYCLMGVKDSYTDFHVDFGGTSVWYHTLKGEKVFYLVKPSRRNLDVYSQWSVSPDQSDTFFGDLVDGCYKCTVKQGQTLFIPTGWIHAVLTPIDSLVFGGNFLHGLNIPLQLKIYDIERTIPTPDKYLFPSFEAVNWYAAKHLTEYFKDGFKESQMYLVDGAKALLAAIKEWAQDKDYAKSQKNLTPETLNFNKIIKDLAKELKTVEKLDNRTSSEKKRRKRDDWGTDSDYEVETPLKIEDTKENEGKLRKKKKGKGRGRGKKRTTRSSRKRTASESKDSDFSDDDKPLLEEIEPPKKKSRVKIKIHEEERTGEVSAKENSPYDFDGSDSEKPLKTKVKAESVEVKTPIVSDTSMVSSPEGRPLKGLSVLAPLKMKLPRPSPQTPSSPEKSPVKQHRIGTWDPNAHSPTKSPSEPLFASPRRLLPGNTSFTSLTSRASMTSRTSMTSAESESDPDEELIVDERPSLKMKLSLPPGAMDASFSDLSSTQSDLNTSQESFSSTRSPVSRRTIPEIRGGLNGSIADILEASGYGTESEFRIDDNLGSPSMRDAIGGLLSMRMGSYQSVPAQEVLQTRTGSHKAVRMRKKSRSEDANDGMKTVYKDDEYVYPRLDDSDEESQSGKKGGKLGRDDTWAPKAKFVAEGPRPARPHREGTRRESVESGLAAAKAALETKPRQKRQYIRKKPRPDVRPELPFDIDARPGTSGLGTSGLGTSGLGTSGLQIASSSKAPAAAPASPPKGGKKARKGQATAKQRLGKILKIHKMMF